MSKAEEHKTYKVLRGCAASVSTLVRLLNETTISRGTIEVMARDVITARPYQNSDVFVERLFQDYKSIQLCTIC